MECGAQTHFEVKTCWNRLSLTAIPGLPNPTSL